MTRLFQSLCATLRGLPPVSREVLTHERVYGWVGKPDPVILEIGSSDGGHTLWLLETFENPRIYCFEPDPRAIARFKATVGERPNIQLYEMALSDRNGEITFHQSGGHRDAASAVAMPEGWHASGSIRKPKRHLEVYPSVIFEKRITVETTTLDSWCEQEGVENIDFIWMDVQGAEIDVFRGGANALARTRLLYTEYSNTEMYEGQYPLHRLLKHLETFRVVARYPTDVLLENTRFAGGRTT